MLVKYLVYRYDNYPMSEIDIRTEDGGIVSIHYNGDNYVTSYYQNRSKDESPNWEELGEGKMYVKDWDSNISDLTVEMVEDALHWLYAVGDYEFVKVETLEELFI